MITAVCIDDSPAELDFVAGRILVAHDIQVVAKETTGTGGLAAVKRWRPTLVTLDLQLTMMHGQEVLRAIIDAKIDTLYEGTTAIQANDLVGRKTARDGGQTARAIAAQIEKTEAELAKRDSADAAAVLKRLKAARVAFVEVVGFVAGNTKASPNAVFSGSVPYLMLAGNVVAGWQLARSLLVAEEQLAQNVESDFMKAKIATARFYAEHILNKVPAVRDSIVDGADSVTALALESF